MNTGIACGGPADGREISSKARRVNVPTIIPGQPGYGVAEYVWCVCVWVYQG